MIKKYFIYFILWIAVPVIIISAIFILQIGILAIIIYSFLILLAISRLMVFLWLRPLTCEREISRDVVDIGEKVSVITKIKNNSNFPILWAYAEETVPEKMSKEGTTKRLFFLPPKRSLHLCYSFIAARRGCHQIGPVVLESGDIFGLFKKFRVDKYRDFITALPKYHMIEEYKLGEHRNLGDFNAIRSIFEDSSKISGIREYQKGDPLKKIHWKASAHSGKLCSKIYEPVVEAGATVVLDFNKNSWENNFSQHPTIQSYEYAVEVACTICRYLYDGRWKVGFFSNGRDPLGMPGVTISQAKSTESLSEALRTARLDRKDERIEPVSIRAKYSVEQFMIIHEHLGRIELSDGLPIESVLKYELPYIERQQVIIVITGDITDSFIEEMLIIRSLGYRLMVFIVENIKAHDKAFEGLTPCGAEIFSLDAKWRLTEIATGRRNF